MSKVSAEAILYYSEHPVQFVKSVIGAEPDGTQCEILQSVVNNKMTSVRSGHGVGKTATLSWLICWFLLTHPHAKIPCTAPTQNTLRDVLWNELAKWIQKSPFLKAHLRWTGEKVSLRGHEDDWYAVARTATKPEALQGFHAQYLMYIIDEASGVPDAVFEPVLGSLSTAGSRLVMCANPTQLSGFFYDSHHNARDSYHCIVADGRKSGRVSEEYVRQIIHMFGEDSDVFRVRVAGEFPLQNDDAFIPLYLLERSVRMKPVVRERPMTIDIACDVARYGNDKTIIGSKIDEVVKIEDKAHGQDTMTTAHKIMEISERIVRRHHFENEIVPVKIDDSGVGGGVTDRLRQIKASEPERFRWMYILPVIFGQHIKNQYFDDTTTLMMANVRSMLLTEDDEGREKGVELILPDDQDLISQFAARKYIMTPNSRVRVESKDKMKERGLSSPDEADCVCMLCLPMDRQKAQHRQGSRRA
ncbi:MAG: hypothetical protein NC311_10600 [Muribaculaceae bacterium]|nr:hypothetical protein [Muribaculaceae bacterium]